MTILRLQSITDDRLNVFQSLTNHQLRNSLDPQRGIVIVESEIAIRVALERGIEPLSFLLDERKLAAMADALASVDKDVPIFVLPTEVAQELTGYRVTRGALCAMRRPQQPAIDRLLATAKNVVVLEGITDTSNVGAVFRNAAALGADAVMVAPTCADPLARRAVRVSMGNVFLVPFAKVSKEEWPNGLFNALHANDFESLSLALDDRAVELQQIEDKGKKRALFFGSEGTGLTRRVLEACDKTVIIPMQRGVDSLNVAASSAVAMWQLFTPGQLS